MSIAKRVQRLFHAMGMNLTRLPGNRFDAMPDVIARLRREGFQPTVVIDVGANVGQWSSTLSAIYPDVPLHVVEPQPTCRAALDAFAARRGATTVHGVVVTRPGRTEVVMAFERPGSTGANVLRDPAGRSDGIHFAATTLDELLSAQIRDADIALLKLDVEGHELDVLAGARSVLRRVEVIVSEVSFFDVENEGHTTFLDYAGALRRDGFELYDFAGLASRRRDGRLRMGDAVFVRRGSRLMADNRWA